MSKTPNIYGGGSKTNKNGLHFEQVTSLNKALGDAGYIIKSNEVYYNKELIGVSVPKKQLYTKFLEKQGIVSKLFRFCRRKITRMPFQKTRIQKAFCTT